jgi:hypothetical protein
LGPRNPISLVASGCGACDKQVRRSAHSYSRIWANRTRHHSAAPAAAAQEVALGGSKLHCGVASRPDVARGARSIPPVQRPGLAAAQRLACRGCTTIFAGTLHACDILRASTVHVLPCWNSFQQGRVGSTTGPVPTCQSCRGHCSLRRSSGGAGSRGCSHTSAHTVAPRCGCLCPCAATRAVPAHTPSQFSTLCACTAGPQSAHCDRVARSSQHTCFHVKCSAIRCPAASTATGERFTALTSPQRATKRPLCVADTAKRRVPLQCE